MRSTNVKKKVALKPTPSADLSPIPLRVEIPHAMVMVLHTQMKAKEWYDFLLISDIHIDHPKCNRKLLKQHLEEVKAKRGYVIINGDLFCAMQGKFDKRANKSSVRTEDSTDFYFDNIVDHAVEFFLPYAENILLVSHGNHETSVIRRLERSLLNRFSDKIYEKTKHRIVIGHYHGWILFRNTTKFAKAHTSVACYKIYYHHGAGGDAPVTEGAIEDNRKMTHVDGADAIWQGHNHAKYSRQKAVMYLQTNVRVVPKLRALDFIRSGTYKQEYTGHGFHIEKGRGPKPLGGVWFKLCYASRNAVDEAKGTSRFLHAEITNTWFDELDVDEV